MHMGSVSSFGYAGTIAHGVFVGGDGEASDTCNNVLNTQALVNLRGQPFPPSYSEAACSISNYRLRAVQPYRRQAFTWRVKNCQAALFTKSTLSTKPTLSPHLHQRGTYVTVWVHRQRPYAWTEHKPFLSFAVVAPRPDPVFVHVRRQHALVTVIAGSASSAPHLFISHFVLALLQLSMASSSTARMLLLTSSTSSAVVPAALREQVGLLRVFHLEHPTIQVQNHDIACTGSICQLMTVGMVDEDETTQDGSICFVARLRQSSATISVSTAGLPPGWYGVTGGLGGLGLRSATLMEEVGAVGIVLSSRSGHVACGDENCETLLTLTQCTSSVFTLAVHVDDILELQLAQQHNIVGVLHAAGVLRDQLTRSSSANALRMVAMPKASAAHHLRSALARGPLVVHALFSSWVANFGSFGQAGYVSANVYLNWIACSQRVSGMSGLALQIPPVSGMGMSASLFESATNSHLKSILVLQGMSMAEYAVFLQASLSTVGGAGTVLACPLPSHSKSLLQVVPTVSAPLLAEIARRELPPESRAQILLATHMNFLSAADTQTATTLALCECCVFLLERVCCHTRPV